MYTLVITNKEGEVKHITQETKGAFYYHPEEKKFQVLVEDESRMVQILIPAEAVYDVITEEMKKFLGVINKQ